MTTAATVNVTTPSEREIVMTRLFDAPRDLVYDCYTKAELLKRWMQPEGWTFTQCDNNLRAGGAFHWRWRNAQGQEMGIRGVYREIVPLQRIVRTEIFDLDPTRSESLGTLSLSEEDRKTTLTIRILYPSQEARDQALTACTDKSVVGAKLDALLTELKRTQINAA
jgi:uncharacterized protein YndB with AHSA1/START domain